MPGASIGSRDLRAIASLSGEVAEIAAGSLQALFGNSMAASEIERKRRQYGLK